MIEGEAICVGDELLSGLVVNSNLAHLGHRLGQEGFAIARALTVGDEEAAIAAAIKEAVQRADFLIVTGGLGPTEDDRTASAAADALSIPLEIDPVSKGIMEAHFAKTGQKMSPAAEKFITLPRNAERIEKQRPWAGFYLEIEGKPLFFLPGVPHELGHMVESFVLPRLKELFPQSGAAFGETVRVFGLTEPQIQERVAPLAERFPGVKVSYLPVFPEHTVYASVSGEKGEAEALLKDFLAAAEEALSPYSYGLGGAGLPEVTGGLLRERGLTIGLAESCTGGLLGHLITGASGSSDYFLGSVVAYHNRVKEAVLGVSPKDIEEKGAVSREVARAMAKAAARVTRADVGVGITGIAGPTGGTEEKPVGTVFIGVFHDGDARVERHLFPGDRWQVKIKSAYQALFMVRGAIGTFWLPPDGGSG